MAFILLQIVLLAGLLTQTANPTPPVRTGFATALTEQDLAAIYMLLPEKPWLLTGDPGQFSIRQFVEAYLPPTTATPVLRRGTSLFVWRRIESSTHKPIGDWTVDQQESQWTQVGIIGRNFDEIQNNLLDINRPFRVVGLFDDAQLIGLVGFLRSNSSIAGDPRNTVQPWPILWIKRENDGSVSVWLREKGTQGQSIDLRQNGQTWVILRFGAWAA